MNRWISTLCTAPAREGWAVACLVMVLAMLFIGG